MDAMGPLLLVLASIFAVIRCISSAGGSAYEISKLMNDITRKNPGKLIRPVRRHHDAVSVEVQFNLIAISGVDAKMQRIILTAETALVGVLGRFRLCFVLSWLLLITVDPRQIYIPGSYTGWIIIYNGTPVNTVISAQYSWNRVGSGRLIRMFTTDSSANPSCAGLVRYTANGKAECRRRRQISAFCPISLRKFPFDEHSCKLKFLSMMQDGYKVDILALEFDINYGDYLPSNEWIVKNSSATREVNYYPCCVEPFPEVNYNITITRRSLAYGLTFVAPGVILGLLVPFVFLSLPFTGDKTGLAASIQISYMLLVVAMMQVEPAILSSVPYLVMYYVVNFMLVGISLGISLLTASSLRHCKKKPPKCLKKLIRRYIPYKKWVPSEDMALDDVTPGSLHRGQDKKNGISREEMWVALAILIDRILFFVFLALSVMVSLALFIIPAIL